MPRTLAQNAQYIAETIKPAIKTAIENKGVTVPSTDSFLDYADRIGEIEGGGSGYQLKDLPTGAISTVSDAEPLPLNALKVSVEAWQEGSGDPSPSNIRPIHGWSTATITDKDDLTTPTQTETYTHAFTDSQCDPLTVYGGEWDVVDGELDNQWGYLYFDGSENAPWVQNTNRKGFYLPLNEVYYPNASMQSGTFLNGVCNEFETLHQDNTGDVTGVIFGLGNKFVFFTGISDESGASAAEFRQWLSTHPLQIKYPLATPTTIPQQAESIRMLEGVNNLYADCGEVIEGEYFIGSSGAYDLYDYIESDGTQYINTGRQISANDVIKCTYMPLSGASFDYWNYVWGCFTSGNMTGVTLITNSIKALYTNGSESRVSYSQNEWYFEETITANAAVNADLYIFSYSNTTAGASIIRLYAFSINGDDYLPCKRRSDGKFGLYDVKNSTFLTDSASGNAITGGNNLGVRIG